MSITALDVANTFIARHPSLFLSNLSLNKLVYFAQVESLRQTGKPLYDSEIQAQQYGPVVPEVYYAFHEWRNLIITSPAMQVKNDSYMNQIVDAVADKYGFLTASDLVAYSHREKKSAWKNTYDGTRNKVISIANILASDDVHNYPTRERTMAQGIEVMYNKYRNTFRILEDA